MHCEENARLNESTRYVESNHQRPKGGEGPSILHESGEEDAAGEVEDNLEQIDFVHKDGAAAEHADEVEDEADDGRVDCRFDFRHGISSLIGAWAVINCIDVVFLAISARTGNVKLGSIYAS